MFQTSSTSSSSRMIQKSHNIMQKIMGNNTRWSHTYMHTYKSFSITKGHTSWKVRRKLVVLENKLEKDAGCDQQSVWVCWNQIGDYLWIWMLLLSKDTRPLAAVLREPAGGRSNISMGYQYRTSTPSLRRYVSTWTSSFTWEHTQGQNIT